MSEGWVLNNSVVCLGENPGGEREGSNVQQEGLNGRRKVLVHVESNEVMTSYSVLESKLLSLGWERYHDDPDLLQFHRRSSVNLISLPKDFKKFKTMYMYDIVVKNPN